MLSKKALEILQSLFAENSNLQLPVGIAKEIVEIREWVEKELNKIPEEIIVENPKEEKS